MADYSRNDAEEILRRAAEREASDGISHDDLVAAASEAGIDASSLEAAAAELTEERDRGARHLAISKDLRRGFKMVLTSWAVLNGGILFIDVVTGPSWWFYWVAFGTGIPLALMALRTFMPSEGTLESVARKLDKRQLRDQHRERTARKQDHRERKYRELGEGSHAGDDDRGPRVRVDESDNRDSSQPPRDAEGERRHRRD